MTGALAVLILLVAMPGLVSRAEAESGFYSSNCAGCHGSSPNTCAGCHAHGTHSSSAKNNLNVTGTTNKTTYVAGETVSVTITGGYRSGWVRAILYDQDMIELARSTGPTGMGGGPSFPVTLSAPAPLTPGTYSWSVSWYGNRFDESGSYFGPRWRPDPGNANHGEELVYTNSFTVNPAAAPVIQLDPLSVDLGVVTVGDSATAPTSVGNAGNATLTVFAVSHCAGTSAEFGWSPAAPFDVLPGGSQSLSVTYEPVDAGSDSGCLAIASNDPATPTVNLSVAGSGEVPPPVDPDVNLNPASLDFGQVAVGEPPTERVTSIENLGTADLVVDEIALCTGTSAEFGWNLTPPFTVAPGASQALTVSYEPMDEGSDAGCLEVHTNDPASPVVSLAVGGSGVIPPPVAADINLDPSSLEYGVVVVGDPSVTLDVQVQNLGNGDLEVTSISLCPGTSVEFTWAPLSPLTVLPGSSETLSVSYTPAGEGPDWGCLGIQSNDPIDPVLTLGVAGNGSAVPPVFGDGFASGDASSWSSVVP